MNKAPNNAAAPRGAPVDPRRGKKKGDSLGQNEVAPRGAPRKGKKEGDSLVRSRRDLNPDRRMTIGIGRMDYAVSLCSES